MLFKKKDDIRIFLNLKFEKKCLEKKVSMGLSGPPGMIFSQENRLVGLGLNLLFDPTLKRFIILVLARLISLREDILNIKYIL